MNLNDRTSVLQCSGGWGFGWNRTIINQKYECIGYLFIAHVHYVVGNENGWFIVSRLLNAFKPFLAPLNSEKANPNCLMIVISESLNCGHDFSLQLFFIFYLQVFKWTSMGFEVQVFEVTANLKL